MRHHSNGSYSAAALDVFVRRWVELADDGPSLRVRPSAANIIVELADELDHANPVAGAAKHLDDPDKFLLARLKAILSNPEIPEVAALQVHHDAAVSQLTALLGQSEPKTSELKPLLDTLKQSIESPFDWIGRWLHAWIPIAAKQLEADQDLEVAMPYAVAAIGVRAALSLVEQSELPKWLGKRLSTGCATPILNEIYSVVQLDEGTLAAMRRWRGRVASRLQAGSFMEGVRNTAAFFPTFDWVALAIREASVAEASVDVAARKLGADCIEFLTAHALYSVLVPVIGRVEPFRTDAWDAVSAGARCLLRAGARGRLIPPSDTADLNRVIEGAIRTTFVRDVAALTAHEVLSSTAAVVAQLHAAMAALVEEHRRIDPSSISPIADVTRQTAIRAMLPGLVELVDHAIQRVLEDVARLSDWRPDAQRFTRAVIWEAQSSENCWRDFEWDNATAGQLTEALQPFANAFGEPRSFDVYLDVLDTVPGGLFWHCGPLLCYDTHRFDFGEGGAGLRVYAEPHVRIRQRVAVRSEQQAREVARRVVGHYLDALSFGTAVNTSHGGLRPSLGLFVYVVDVSRDSSMLSGQRDRFDSSDKQVAGSMLKTISAAYDTFMRRVASGQRLSDLEDRTLRALFWYRSGRWQQDAVRRFLDHAVALEHLFARDQRRRKTRSVADGVAKFFKSWQFRHDYAFSMLVNAALNEARGLRELLFARPEAAEKMRETLEDPDRHLPLRVLMTPRCIEMAAASATDAGESARWQTHLRTVQRFRTEEPDWEDADQARADRKSFAVQLLFRRRHRIVHEAITSAPGIGWDANALTGILEDILKIITTVVLDTPDPSQLSMSDVYRYLAVPWR